MKRVIVGIVTIFMLAIAVNAYAKGRLVVYCSNEPFACQAVADAFSKKYDVKVQMTRAGSGSTYAKILAEKDNPKGDVWYAGTLDPHSQAGVNGLLEPYKSLTRQAVQARQHRQTRILVMVWGALACISAAEEILCCAYERQTVHGLRKYSKGMD